MSRAMLLAGAVLCLAAGCEYKTAPELLQGQWQRYEMRGRYEFGLLEGNKDENFGGILLFTGDEFTFLNGTNAGHGVKGTFSCDTTTKPQRILFSFDGRTVVAIFSVGHETLRVCVGKEDDVPPTDFVLRGTRGERPT